MCLLDALAIEGNTAVVTKVTSNILFAFTSPARSGSVEPKVCARAGTSRDCWWIPNRFYVAG